MPDEALFSSELEKEWTGPEMQLLLSQHKHSRKSPYCATNLKGGGGGGGGGGRRAVGS